MWAERTLGKEMCVKPISTEREGEVSVQSKNPTSCKNVEIILKPVLDIVNKYTNQEENYRNTKGLSYHLRSMKNFGCRLAPIVKKLEIIDLNEERNESALKMEINKHADQVIATVAHGAAVATLSINSRKEKVLIDSGALTSMISEELAVSLNASYEAVDDKIIWRTAGKTRLTVLGKTKISIQLGEDTVEENVLVTRDLSHRAILGVDIMRKHKMNILFDGDWLIFREQRVKWSDTQRKTINAINISEFRPSQLVQIDESNMSEE